MSRKLIFGMLLFLTSVHVWGMARNFLAESVYFVHLTYNTPDRMKYTINLTKFSDMVRHVLSEHYPSNRTGIIVESTYINGRVLLDFSVPSESEINLVVDEVAKQLNAQLLAMPTKDCTVATVHTGRDNNDQVTLNSLVHEKKSSYKLMDVILLGCLLVGVFMWMKPRDF